MAATGRADSGEELSSPRSLDLSIIIVGYNSRDLVGQCLTSIFESCVDARFEVIVTDNDSSDGTPAFVREAFPEVRVIENSRNLGYSTAVNQAIGRSHGRYVLVLNPDIVVLERSIDRLFEFMENHADAGIAGAKLLNEDGSVQYSCRRFYTFWTLLLRRTPLGKMLKRSRAIERYLMLDFDHRQSRAVDWIIGACMMVRKHALADVGLMDERFFLYFEDVDWCYRMAQRGWKVYYVADAAMHHRHARASAKPGLSKSVVTHLMSMFHFYEKWGRASYTVKRYRQLILGAFLFLSDLLAINASFAIAYVMRSSLRGVLDKPLFGAGVYGTFLVFANLVLVLSFAFFGLYGVRSAREVASDLMLRVLRAVVVGTFILMASTFLTSQTVYSRVLVGLFVVLVIVLVTSLRVLLRWVQHRFRAGRFGLTRTVIVGTGTLARRLSDRLSENEAMGYDVVGLVDAGEGLNGTTRTPLMGRLSELPELIERQRIDEVVFAAPGLSSDELADFLMQARRSAVDVKMVSGLAGILTHRTRVEEFLDFPVLAFEREALLRAGAGVKRLLDVIGSAALLAVSSPVLAFASLARRARSNGSLVVRVARAGLDTGEFAMYVLRPDDEKSAVRAFAERHGLASFPALVNVFKGDMSFVGPSPVAPEGVSRYGLKERVRFDARPGLVGLAEVSIAGAAVTGDDAAALDVYYVQNWSLLGDLRILLRVLSRALAGRMVTEERGRPPSRKE